MKDITSQILYFASVVLIPFIPNDILRSIMFALVPLVFTACLVHHNTPHRWVERLDASMKEVNDHWKKAIEDCARDPRFIHETNLKLSEIKYALSTLRTRTISMQFIPWRIYPYYIITIGWAINRCRRDMERVRSSILLALERGRQQVFQQDIDQKKATLVSAFPGAFDATAVVGEDSVKRAIAL
ncbi:hypothetical protein C8F04DRAFT_1262662 [Mycena alexandri]|uniref:Uncharacterized protein n=1 Tax=Mycena alexandri TaxID=1745969 RepID=A0AAD6X1N8_9AGAR|nr:hypothetical protein C8F04DRAFT_1262662 [Mycena alexandri]